MARSPHYLLSLLQAGALAALFVACSHSKAVDEYPPTPDKPFLALCDTLTAFAAGGGEAEFSFSTNRDWRIDPELQEGDEGDWYEVSPLSGEAGERIAVAVSVDPNEAYAPRSVVLVLHVDDLEERIEVVQLKKNVILLGDNRCEVTFQEQTLSVQVRSNVDYGVAVTQGADWLRETPGLRAEGLKDSTHTFRVERNPAPQDRTAIVVFTDKGSQLSDELTVVQAAWVDPDPERTALRAIYDAAGGGGWTRNENWCSDRPLGEWYGVETDSEGHVTALRLPKNNLIGTLSQKVASLAHLRDLDLSWNALGGEIGSVDGQDYLGLGDLSCLESLDLSHNRFEGGTPIDWYKLARLQRLDLSSNRLEGYAIPIQWAPMFENGRMVDLILNNNYLYGDIPAAIQDHPEWGRMALQMIRQLYKEGSPYEMVYDKDVHLPDFTFTDVRDGSHRAIRDIYAANKLTMLLAWDPTQERSRIFMETTARRFHTLYGGQGFGVVAITPEGEAYREAAERYVRTHPVAWPVVAEYADAAGRRLILPSYPYPSYLLVDQSGKVTLNMFDGQPVWDIPGQPDTMDMLSLKQTDLLNGLSNETFGWSEYRSTDFSMDKHCETLQTATRGKGIDIMFIGEAFTDIDIETGFYKQLMNYAMESFFALEPTKSYRDYFTVHMVYAVSKNSYISEDRNMSALQTATSTWRDGHIDPYFTVIDDYIRICPGSSLNCFPSIIINNYSSGITYMNSASKNYVFLGYYPGLREYTKNILLHEAVGHGFGCLADEYDNALSGNYEITESEKQRLREQQARNWCLNVSLSEKPALVPWSHLIGHIRYPNVGIHEGGYYFVKGVWRSEPESIMRNHLLDVFFNAISRELIVRRIMELSGEGYTFEKFLENDKDDRQISLNSLGKVNVPEKLSEFRHVPPIFVD